MLNQKDFKDLNSIDKNMFSIQDQLAKLSAEKINFSIVKPATLGEGIQEFSFEEQTQLQAFFDQHSSTINSLKFGCSI